jgi:ribosomal protein S27AE
MIDRVSLAQQRGWDVTEIYRAKDAWRKLYVRQPQSDLTFDAYLDMQAAAGLRPSMIGLRRGQYHLARYADSGSYTKDNCRFIPQEENQQERKEGYQSKPEFRALVSKLALQRKRTECPQCGKSVTPGMYARWHGDKCKGK